MNVINLFLLFFVMVGVAMGVFLIAGNGVTTPVDSSGQTVSVAKNLSADNATLIVKTAAPVSPWIAFIVVVLIIAAIFLWALSQRSNHPNFLSRYQ